MIPRIAIRSAYGGHHQPRATHSASAEGEEGEGDVNILRRFYLLLGLAWLVCLPCGYLLVVSGPNSLLHLGAAVFVASLLPFCAAAALTLWLDKRARQRGQRR